MKIGMIGEIDHPRKPFEKSFGLLWIIPQREGHSLRSVVRIIHFAKKPTEKRHQYMDLSFKVAPYEKNLPKLCPSNHQPF